MASIIDEQMDRHGSLVPGAAGVFWARAADAEWTRNEGEAEKDFLTRARHAAKAAGYRIVRFGGAIETDDT